MTELSLVYLRLLSSIDCDGSTFFGIGTWHKYITSQQTQTRTGAYCTLDFNTYGLGTFWLVIAGLLDILLRVGALVAVGYFIFGAFKMVTSQGSPEGVKSARGTMTNAIIGLVICIVATWVLGFLMERILA